MLAFPGGAGAGAPAGASALLDPPEDLSGVERQSALGGGLATAKDFWRRLAPHAIAQGTLVSATVPGFRELCELMALKEEVWARLQRFGSDGKTGAERLRNYTKLSQRLDATLGRFKLTAFGKPANDGVPNQKPGANPFAQLGS